MILCFPLMEISPLFFLLLSLLLFQSFSHASDVITHDQTLKNGDTLISSNGIFELGFFSPPNSLQRFLGVWYHDKDPRTVVWVANRVSPLFRTSSAVLKFVRRGVPVLAIFSDENTTVWSADVLTASSSVGNPVARLLDSGNLVVRDGEQGRALWQSFDYPTDTLLPGLKIGRSFVSGRETVLSSWKTESDPSPGDMSLHCGPERALSGWPECFVMRNGTIEVSRSGPWNGLGWSGVPGLRSPAYLMDFVFNDTEVSISYGSPDKSVVSHVFISKDGTMEREWMNEKWRNFHALPQDNCDQYGLCGPNGYCNIEKSPPCTCLDKFVPKDREGSRRPDMSKGCVRRTELDCNNGSRDGFLKYSGIKLPDTRKSWFNRTMSLNECERFCLRNCSCTAYSTLNISDGSGCLVWFGDLIDIRYLSEIGQDIYIRLASSELPKNPQHGTRTSVVAIVVSVSIGTGLVLAGLGLVLYCRGKNKDNGNLRDDLELPLFELSKIAKATNNFSDHNKLGEGGFGSVYKGVMEDGQRIAVKRLSKTSMQGTNEFKNEVICIAKLQHRNLVKLFGCCICGEEKMLVYEYMPNNSLDSFIFDETKKLLLDWPKRLNIINGIARGLLYLHQDSRLRVIHRDLKASNVLLDIDMNPKISDFGLARSVGGNETGAKTSMVVGTHGYMAPEYAIHGVFSVKSDVFSFGVCVIEIISGTRNRGFRHQDHYQTLLGHAWKLYTDGKSIELIDEHLAEHCNLSQVLRCIHIGLLCVQQFPEDRPNMSYVVKMLDSEDTLCHPKEPGFFSERRIESDSSLRTKDSINEISYTVIDPR